MCRISENHEVTIPEAALRDVGLATGDDVEIRCIGLGRIENRGHSRPHQQVRRTLHRARVSGWLSRRHAARLAVVQEGPAAAAFG
jgi:hypothetical protein